MSPSLPGRHRSASELLEEHREAPCTQLQVALLIVMLHTECGLLDGKCVATLGDTRVQWRMVGGTRDCTTPQGVAASATAALRGLAPSQVHLKMLELRTLASW